MARAFAQIEELQALLEKAQAAGPRTRPKLDIAEQLEEFEARIREQAQAAIETATTDALARTETAELKADAAERRAESEASLRLAAEQRLDAERQARQQAEAKSQSDQRARIEAEGGAERERMAREAAERKAKEMPMHKPPQTMLPPKPLGYDIDVERGPDGLIANLKMRPL